MPIGTIIKWSHRALTAVLLLVVVGGGVIWYLDSAPRNDRLFSQRQLSDSVWLYVTKYQDAGATDSDVYRYYVNQHLTDPMHVLAKAAPFLEADRGNASVSAIGDHILVSLNGKVYSFSNTAFYYDGKVPIMPRIDLNSTAVNPWK